MRGMLLAAGLGTRLAPLTEERPKPAVPLGLEPIAVGALRTFARANATRIDVNAYHLPDALASALAPHSPPTIPLTIHPERELLGTGGGIRGATRDGPRDEVLVMNGDIVFEPDLDALVRVHRESAALVTLVVREHPDPFALGAVEVDDEGFVRRIAGAPGARLASAAAYVFTGVHLLAPDALAYLPERGCVVRDAYQPMLAEGLRIAAVVDPRPWADLGTIPAYFDANMELADRSPDPRGVVHPDARIEGEVRRSIVGRNARLGPNAVVDRCIVWDGASIDEPIANAVITERRRVRVVP